MTAFVRRVHTRLLARWRHPRYSDIGASVLEWALIAAVVVVAASIIGAVIFNVVQDKSSELERCANVPAGSTC